MIRLAYDQKPNDCNLTISRVLEPWRWETSDLIWMSQAEWFLKPIYVTDTEDSELFSKIMKLVPAWKNEAASHDNDKDWWPVKSASIIFWYNDIKYTFGPGLIDADDYTFERASNTIEEDLYQLGAMYVEYQGMLD